MKHYVFHDESYNIRAYEEAKLKWEAEFYRKQHAHLSELIADMLFQHEATATLNGRVVELKVKAP
jgi:hypothetical protein